MCSVWERIISEHNQIPLENQLLPRVEEINAEGTKPDIKIGRQQAPLAI